MQGRVESKSFMAAKYVFDTNVYIRCLLDRDFALQHAARYASRVPFTFVSAVVVQELVVGCVDEAAVERAEKFFTPFEKAGRILSTSYGDWKEAAIVAVRIAARRPDLKSKKVMLLNDILIALSCRRIGAILVTLNSVDFEVIRRFVRFRTEVF